MEHITSYLKSEIRPRTTGAAIRIVHAKSQTDNNQINSAIPPPHFEPGAVLPDSVPTELPDQVADDDSVEPRLDEPAGCSTMCDEDFQGEDHETD